MRWPVRVQADLGSAFEVSHAVTFHVDTSRAKERFGFETKTTFEEGLKQPVVWYQATAHGEN